MIGVTARQDAGTAWERPETAEHSARSLDVVLTYMSQGLCLYDAEERVVLCNRRYQEIIGLEPGAVRPGMTFSEVLRQSMSNDAVANDTETQRRIEQVREMRSRTVGVAHRIRSMELLQRGRFISVTYNVLPDGGWVATLDDVTDQHLAESRITRLAHFDTLSGLPNRTSFLDHLRTTLLEGTGPAAAALLYIDLDWIQAGQRHTGTPGR